MTTRVIDTDAREDDEREEERWIDSESEAGEGRDDFDREPEARGGWDDDGNDDVIPPRPRGRMLRPLPMVLLALIIAAAGFLGGIEAQKGSEGGGATAGPGGGGLPNFAALKEAAAGGSGAGGSESSSGVEGATGAESAGGFRGFGGSSAAATGTVTSVEGHTIYVKEADGTTVAVKAGDGSTVTRDSNVAAKKIHPGDTVVVQGSKKGSTVTASSIAATESGVESTAVAGAPSAGAESETSVESLFEE